jgi:cytidylate kinase
VALAALQAGVDLQDKEEVLGIAQKIKIVLQSPSQDQIKAGLLVSVFLNNQDVSLKIRELQYGEGASIVGTYPKVRQILVKKQQEMSEGKKIVMEGRDIGTVVLPQANMKIYLVANLDERVRRKIKAFKKAGKKISSSAVKADILSRDHREMTRKQDPLKPAKDAWVLDTTNLTIPLVLKTIINKFMELYE